MTYSLQYNLIFMHGARSLVTNSSLTVHAYIHTYIHIYIYIYICVCVYISSFKYIIKFGHFVAIGKHFLQWYGVQPQMIIAELELCKEVLHNKDRNYRKQRSQGYIKKLLGDSISMAEGEKWVKLRKLAHHAFHGESLKVINLLQWIL